MNEITEVRNWRWSNFTPDEFRCKGSGEVAMNQEFMDRLQRLRGVFARPMIVTSGYRSPEHNDRVSKTGRDGPHTTGRAADIQVSGSDAFELFRIVLAHGFTGIGVMQKGPHKSRFIHLDDLEQAPSRPRPRLWSY